MDRPDHARPPAGRGDPASVRISRRELLAGATLGGVGLFLAACGSTTTPSPPASLGVAPTAGPPASPPAPGSLSPAPSTSATPTRTAPPPVSLRHRIAGLMVVGFRGSELSDAAWVRAALAESGLGGVILFDRDQLTGGSRNV